MYKELKQFNSKTKAKKNLVSKVVEDVNTHISNEDIVMTNRYLKKCSTSIIIREMQTKIAKRYHLPSVRMAINKKIRNNKCW